MNDFKDPTRADPSSKGSPAAARLASSEIEMPMASARVLRVSTDWKQTGGGGISLEISGGWEGCCEKLTRDPNPRFGTLTTRSNEG